jgi:hypothetical protein
VSKDSHYPNHCSGYRDPCFFAETASHRNLTFITQLRRG